MLNSKTDMEWIDGFLQEHLSKAEVLTFQERLSKDSSFAALFEEQQVLAAGIRMNLLTDKVRHFQQLGQEVDGDLLDDGTIGEAVRLDRSSEILERFRAKGKEMDEVVALPKRKKWNWQLAASLLLPFGLFFSLWSNYLTNQLPNENYLTFPVSGTMGNSSTNDGFLLYKEGKFEESFIALDEIKPTSELYPEAQVIQGEILFRNKKEYLLAFEKFTALAGQDDLLAKQNKDFKERLEWNTVLAAKKTGMMTSDLSNTILMNPKHKFHQNAIALNKKISFYQYLKWASWLAIIIGLLGLVFWIFSKRNKLTT